MQRGGEGQVVIEEEDVRGMRGKAAEGGGEGSKGGED